MSAFTDQLAADQSSTFLNTDEFAVSATYTPSGGSASTVKVIFDGPFDLVSPEGIPFENQAVSVLGRKSDFSSAKNGDSLVISGTTYYVLGVKPNDADDMVRLVLGLEAQHG